MVTRYTGPMVTRCIGGLYQLPVVQMSWGKKSKKKFSNLNISSDKLVPWLPGNQAHRWSISGLLKILNKTICSVGKDWYGFGLMESVNFGLCEYYLLIW